MTAITDPDPVQLLTPEGQRIEHPDFPLELTSDQAKGLYRDLVLVREFDEQATALAKQGELALWPSLLGQEAAQVGSGRALSDRDMAFTSYREHGVAYCLGIPLIRPLGLFRGVHHGWRAHQGAHWPYHIVVGSQTLHACGYAMGIQRDGVLGTPQAAAAIAYFGDGATSQGDVNESFVFASVFNAPIVFFCQNNQWAISEPLERQSRVSPYRRAAGFGFPGIRVDGNDVFASLAVTRKALAAARAGQGPTLIEAYTYRMAAHTTTDDPSRYRQQADLDVWRAKDPIDRVRKYLLHNQIATPAFFEDTQAEARKAGRDLREACLALPDPAPSALFEHIYAEPHALIDAERLAHAGYLATFEETTA